MPTYISILIMTVSVVPNMFYHVLNQCKNMNRNKYVLESAEI